MNKQILTTAVIIISFALLSIGCVKQKPVEEGTTSTDNVDATAEEAIVGSLKEEEVIVDMPVEQTEIIDAFDETIFDDKDDNYKAMIERSFITAGNNYRLKKAIEKAKKGEEVVIAYIGGSITEGYNSSTSEQSYAYQSYLYFKETYGGSNSDHIKFINAGMAGTPSTLGMIRYDRDVTAKGTPDIVIIEFAVNDGDDPTNGDAYESLVLNVLQSEAQPAVVLLFSVFQSKWNLQDRFIPVGNHYKLPMISIKDAVVPELEAGTLTNAEFFADQWHPSNYGHEIMADSIKYYFSTVNSTAADTEDITISDTPKIGNSFVGIKMIDSTFAKDHIQITPGSFNGTDFTLAGLRNPPGAKTFPNNWKHEADGGNDSFKLTLNCKNFLLVYKISSSKTFGTADIYVDGEKVKTINSQQSGGWNNAYTVVIVNEKASAERTIEIKMAEGEEEKEFTILAFGYTD